MTTQPYELITRESVAHTDMEIGDDREDISILLKC
jgi:hypothetical protein